VEKWGFAGRRKFMGVIERLEKELGKPVISGNTASWFHE